jgi:flavin-dependent dehydrogenase
MRFGAPVVVLGGGPAGCAAAIGLSQAGFDVTILERSGYDNNRIGETLPPSGMLQLQRLGVWENFLKEGHHSSPGIVSAWESDQPYEKDFIFTPYGKGWHLNRGQFDRSLAEAAEQKGAGIFLSVRIRECIANADQSWVIRYDWQGEKREIAASFVIDATGRPAWLTRQQGARRSNLDRLVAVIGFASGAEGTDRRTFLEAAPNGWWYSARLPNQNIVTAFMTDADLLPRGSENLGRHWKEWLWSAPLTSKFWPDPNTVGELVLKNASTSRLDRFHGPGWLATGDAAMAFDPLSSQGIVKALESGWRAATSTIEYLQGSKAAMTAYSDWLNAEFTTYVKHYHHYYSQVHRWPEAAFWRRRLMPFGNENVYS